MFLRRAPDKQITFIRLSTSEFKSSPFDICTSHKVGFIENISVSWHMLKWGAFFTFV